MIIQLTLPIQKKELLKHQRYTADTRIKSFVYQSGTMRQ